MEKQIFLDFNVRFNLREPKQTKQTIIYAIVSVGQKQMKINTGVKIIPSHWDNIRCVASLRGGLTPLERYNNAICNNKLQSIAFEIEKLRLYLNDNYNEFEFNKFKTLFCDSINTNNPTKNMNKEINATIQLRQLIGKQNIEESSKVLKVQALKLFANWLNENKIEDTFENISKSTLSKYESYLISKDKKPTTIQTNFAHIVSIIRHAKQLEIYPNTLNIGVENYKTTAPKLSKKQQNSKQFSLTEEEINTIYYYDNLEGKKKEIKDCFILQIEVGQRIGDMLKIINKEFKTSADGKFIRLQQDKTNPLVSIPFTTRIKEIFNKYKAGFNYINKLNDKALTAAFSYHLPKIAEEIGLNRIHTYQEEKGRKVITKTDPIYKIIHSHTARHTFITTKLRNGMPKEELMIITGHADDSMINDIYSHLTQEDKERNILKAQDKIDNERNQQQVQQQPQSQQNNLSLIEEIKNSTLKENENKTVRVLKEILTMMGVDPFVVTETNDSENLFRLVRDGENELFLLGLPTPTVKEIFNENLSLRERAENLHRRIKKEAK